MVERNRGILPFVIDPKIFLDGKTEALEVGELQKAPDLKLLRWLPTLEIFTGMYLLDSKWYVVKAGDSGISSRLLPQNAQVSMFSRPADENEKQGEEAIPGVREFLNCSSFSKNFIVSSSGITQYWSVDEAGKRALRGTLEAFTPRFEKASELNEYKDFLKKINAEYQLNPWSKLSDKKLQALLHR